MRRIAAFAAFLLLSVACSPITSRAPIQSSPDVAAACAGDLLASMGYDLLAEEPLLRAERVKHAAFGRMRTDYDRVTVSADAGQLRVRGETVSMSGGSPMMALRGRVASSAGGTTVTRPSKELRADVQRVITECAGAR